VRRFSCFAWRGKVLAVSITIDNPETERLARELARRRGVGVAEAVTAAIEAELERAPTPAGDAPALAEKLENLRRIARESAALPILDDRSDEEILGYDDIGLPR